MSQVPMDHTFITPDGSTAKQSEAKDAPVITSRDVLIVATTNDLPEDSNPSTPGQNLITQKLARFSIWQKLKNEEAKVVQFTHEEITWLRERVAKIFGMVISAPMIHMLDGKNHDGTPVQIAQSDPAKEVK